MTATSADFYSLKPNEVEYLKKNFREHLIVQADEKTFGRQCGNHVRRRPMVIEGAPDERMQSINLILKKIKRWRRLKAPNVISIHGFVTTLEKPLLKVVSYCPSTTIMKYLKKHPGHNKLTCCVNIAAGLDYLHRESIIHGAIRGSNVLVKEDGTCFLGEFASEEIPSKKTLARYASWTAPELGNVEAFWKLRVDNYGPNEYKGEYKQASDIFAMGCTALEIYTATAPKPFSFPKQGFKSFAELVHYKREPVPNEQKLIPPLVLKKILGLINPSPVHRTHSGNALTGFILPDVILVTAAPPIFAKSAMRRLARNLS